MESSKENVGTPQNVSTRKQTDVDIENLMREVEFLRNENTILKGRIRGTDTLGTLLQEAREANLRLSEQKEQLQKRLNDSLRDREKNNIKSGEVITSLSQINLVYQPYPTNQDNNQNTRNNSVPTQLKSVDAKSMAESGISSQKTSETRRSMSQVQPTDSHVDENGDLQYDSDKFEDAGFSKMEDLNINSFNGVLFTDLMSTGLSSASSTSHIGGDTQPTPLLSYPEIPEVQPIQTSTGESLVNASKLQEMIKMVNMFPKVYEEKQKYKKLYQVIATENAGLKKQIMASKEEHHKLLHKIRQLEHARDNISSPITLLTSEEKEWIHVTTGKEKKLREEELRQGTLYSEAIKQNKELNLAVKTWQNKWSSLEKEYITKNQKLINDLESVKQELKQVRQSHEENQIHGDQMLFNAKKRVEEEEEAKMDAENALGRANQQISKLKIRIEDLEAEVADLKRKKNMMESELTIIKSAGNKTCDETRESDKDTEIAVLKQQITVCTEDFERERQDRAAAQSARSVTEEQNQQLLAEKENLTAQINRMTAQLQDLEMTRNQLESDNRNHQRQNQTLQAEIQRLKGQLQASIMQINRTGNAPPFGEPLHLPNPITQNIYRESVPTRPPIYSSGSLEHLPGAWTCAQCTYINYPGRTVCEVCGCITESGQSQNNLQPRGKVDTPMMGLRDVEVDTCY